MGSRYLTDLADVYRRSGWPVIEVDGWQNRARGSGGYDSGRPNHVMTHHTASGASSDGWPDVNYMTFNHTDAPLCNLYLDRQGNIYVCAGGATNTNGSGHDTCGITNDDSMNSSAIGIEAGNNGVGEQWPDAQQDAYVALCKALCDGYGIGVGRDGFTWSGVQSISRKAEWPDWYPPPAMIARQPYLPRMIAGGPGNPLGARAMYIGGTEYRIHGTNDPSSIGKHISSGCIRMTNDNVIDLYNRVSIGAKVIVLPIQLAHVGQQ